MSDDYNPDQINILMKPIQLKPEAKQAMREYFIEAVAQEVFRLHSMKPPSPETETTENEPAE